MITLEQAKADIAEIRANNEEAVGELATRIADLDAQIAALVLANTNPAITDAQFEADLAAAKASSGVLASIVSTPPVVDPPVVP